MSQTPDPTLPTSPSTPTAGGTGTTPASGGTSSGAPAKDPLRHSRVGSFYAAVIGLGVVLLLLVIFVVQNTDDASVTFLAWEGTAPQAVLLLIAVAAGIFLTATAGSLRLIQVRRRVKKERRR